MDLPRRSGGSRRGHGSIAVQLDHAPGKAQSIAGVPQLQHPLGRDPSSLSDLILRDGVQQRRQLPDLKLGQQQLRRGRSRPQGGLPDIRGLDGTAPAPGGIRSLRHIGLLWFLRVGGAGGHGGDTENHGRQGDPELRLLPAQGVFDAALHIGFPEAQRCGSGELSSLGKVKKRTAVCLCLTAQFPEYPLIAAHLHIPAHEEEGRPHCGIEPVDRQQKIGQQLHPMVSPADMDPLMGKDIGAFFLPQPRRDVDPGWQQAQDEGYPDTVGGKNALFQGRRVRKPSLHPDIPDDPQSQHHSQPADPEDDAQSRPKPDRLDCRDRRCCDGCRYSSRGDGSRRRSSGSRRDRKLRGGWHALRQDHGVLCPANRVHDRGPQTEEAENRLKAYRTAEPESDSAPQEIPPFFRRGPQQQTHKHHNCDDDRSGNAHIQHPQKQTFHLSPPDAHQ